VTAIHEKFIQSLLFDLPEKPGVYLMKDTDGHIVYVGKAVVLKNRVRQYFLPSLKEERTKAMVAAICSFDYIITLTEKDALSLEANLIKKHKPRYNILLKDDKQAPYIRINTKQKFPYIEIVRRVKNDGALYFGPYFFDTRITDIIEVVKSVYKIRACPRQFFSKSRECLNYHINLCFAPCQGKITQEDYKKNLDKAVNFLSGKDNDAQKIIEEKMVTASEKEEFERAMQYRDQLLMLKKLKSKAVGELGRSQDLDAIAFCEDGSYGGVSVVIVRGGKLMGAKNFPVQGASIADEDGIRQFLTAYYATADAPSEIVLQKSFDTAALEEYLEGIRGKKVTISFPQKAIKKKLLAMAEENARDCLIKSIDRQKREEEMSVGAAKRLGEILQIPYPRRIECYDISHLSGTDMVASGVCFIDGVAAKKEYRRYKIKTVEGVDDFASLAEVIGRRMNRAANENAIEETEAKWELPDLIVIDGGKGQLSFAHAAMQTAGFNIPMIALAEKKEDIYLLGKSEPLVLPKESFALKLLQRVRDEAHRFALGYHHKLRSKRMRK